MAKNQLSPMTSLREQKFTAAVLRRSLPSFMGATTLWRAVAAKKGQQKAAPHSTGIKT